VLWKISDGTPVWEALGTTSGIESIAFSPDGSMVAAAGGNRGLDTRIRVLSATDGHLLQSLITSNSYGVRQLVFSPNGQWLAAGCYESASFAGGVEIWRTCDWTRHRRLPITAPTLAFSPGGRSLITLRNRTMDFWSFPDGGLLQSFGIPESGVYSLHQSVAVSPQGDRIITGNYKQVPTPNGTITEGSTTAFRLPVMLSFAMQDENHAKLDWTGGYTLYQVQRRAFDEASWSNYGQSTTSQSIILPLDGSGGMFRVVGTAP
jgi:hypothetical protein